VSVSADHGALASSGDYERYITVDGRRYCHILNPITGWPSHGLAAVSVMADQCLVAGTVSTIAMLKGRDGIRWLSDRGLKHFFVDENGICGGDIFVPMPHSNLSRGGTVLQNALCNTEVRREPSVKFKPGY
jgi:hypothetical protein